jgi:hypothetical protein
MVHSACIIELVNDSNGVKIIRVCFFDRNGEEVTTLRIDSKLLGIENPKKGMAIQFSEKKLEP